MKAGGVDIEDMAAHVLAESRQASGYAQRLAEMRPLDRSVLRAILKNTSLYSEDSRNMLSAEIGLEGEPLSTRQVQVAVDRLLAEQIIYQSGRGHYQIEDHQLAEWLLAIPDL